MTSLNALFNEGKTVPIVPNKLLKSFTYIATDPAVRSGWPHIKNTRILVTDIFRAQVKGNSPEALLKDFEEMGVKVKRSALDEAYRFTVEWLFYLNERESPHTSS